MTTYLKRLMDKKEFLLLSVLVLWGQDSRQVSSLSSHNPNPPLEEAEAVHLQKVESNRIKLYIDHNKQQLLGELTDNFEHFAIESYFGFLLELPP